MGKRRNNDSYQPGCKHIHGIPEESYNAVPYTYPEHISNPKWNRKSQQVKVFKFLQEQVPTKIQEKVQDSEQESHCENTNDCADKVNKKSKKFLKVIATECGSEAIQDNHKSSKSLKNDLKEGGKKRKPKKMKEKRYPEAIPSDVDITAVLLSENAVVGLNEPLNETNKQPKKRSKKSKQEQTKENNLHGGMKHEELKVKQVNGVDAKNEDNCGKMTKNMKKKTNVAEVLLSNDAEKQPTGSADKNTITKKAKKRKLAIEVDENIELNGNKDAIDVVLPLKQNNSEDSNHNSIDKKSKDKRKKLLDKNDNKREIKQEDECNTELTIEVDGEEDDKKELQMESLKKKDGKKRKTRKSQHNSNDEDFQPVSGMIQNETVEEKYSTIPVIEADHETPKKPKKKKSKKKQIENAIDCEVSEIEEKATGKKSKKRSNITEPDETYSETVAGQWANASLGDGDRKQKFLKLMGGEKAAKKVGTKSKTSKKHGQALDASQENELYTKLQVQYNQALQTLTKGKGSGIGFTQIPGAGKKFYIDANKTKSLKFDE